MLPLVASFLGSAARKLWFVFWLYTPTTLGFKGECEGRGGRLKATAKSSGAYCSWPQGSGFQAFAPHCTSACS